MEPKLEFFIKDGKLSFIVTGSDEVDRKVRASLKRKTVKPGGKQEKFFRRGVTDAFDAVLENRPRKFGTPVVKLTNPFTGAEQEMTCQKAKRLLNNIRRFYTIEQVSGAKLDPNYFNGIE